MFFNIKYIKTKNFLEDSLKKGYVLSLNNVNNLINYFKDVIKTENYEISKKKINKKIKKNKLIKKMNENKINKKNKQK